MHQTMRINAPKGTKVEGVFKNGQICNGHDWQQRDAEKYIKPHIQYTVDTTIIHDFSTEVFLQEFPNKAFNSVHFFEV